MRFTIGAAISSLEITCVTSEVDAVRAWLERHGAASTEQALPVPEHPDPCPRPAIQNRWTLAADTVYRAALATMPRAVRRGAP
jgi:hypothetical protein